MKHVRAWQFGLLLALFAVWHLLTVPGLLPKLVFENDQQAAFFFGEPLKVLAASASGSLPMPTSTATSA
jgi:NitT/TauT family transport system permease protein